jgi:hypothetical protein
MQFQRGGRELTVDQRAEAVGQRDVSVESLRRLREETSVLGGQSPPVDAHQVERVSHYVPLYRLQQRIVLADRINDRPQEFGGGHAEVERVDRVLGGVEEEAGLRQRGQDVEEELLARLWAELVVSRSPVLRGWRLLREESGRRVGRLVEVAQEEVEHPPLGRRLSLEVEAQVHQAAEQAAQLAQREVRPL